MLAALLYGVSGTGLFFANQGKPESYIVLPGQRGIEVPKRGSAFPGVVTPASAPKYTV